jgi:3-oxoacyl-[acyl-carrier protein] reductase
VAFTYLSSVAAAESLVAEIEALGARAAGYASNAADYQNAHDVVEQVVAEFGQIDILVNNAGQTKDGLMMRMSEEQWDSIIDTNLKSAFNFIHAVTPLMARRRAGSIINMSSVVGTNGNVGQTNYSASKAGLIGLTKSMAKEMGSRGIRSNAIAPGFIVTDMTDKLSEDIRNKIVADISLGRMGTVDEVANVALFLASDMSSYVSGEVIKVAGCMKG